MNALGAADVSEADLRAVAEAVRARLEKADLSTAHECFRYFPRGACGATCDVLATVLERRFGVRPLWVNAEIREGEVWKGSHAWLEVEGLTIDITADQFGEAPVIVTKHSPWHHALPILKRDYFPFSDRNWGWVGHSVWHLVSDLAVPLHAEPQ